MLAPLLALALAANPVPRSAVVIPHGKSLEPLRALLTRAGSYAPTLSPGPLGRALGAALALDALDRSAYAEAGLDPDGPVSLLGFDGGALALVLPVKDAGKVQARAVANLPSLGTVRQEKRGGVTSVLAERPAGRGSELAGGVALSKTRAALWVDGADPAFLRAALTARPPGAERASGLAGEITLLSDAEGTAPALAVGLSPSATGLAVDARAMSKAPALAASARDPFAKLEVAAPIVIRASLAGPALVELRRRLQVPLRALLSRAGVTAMPPQVAELLERLTGPSALVITGLDGLRGAGSTELDRAFLPSQAAAAQVREPAQVQAALEALGGLLRGASVACETVQAPVAGTHLQLKLDARRAIYLGLVGEVLYLADDPGARDLLLGGLATASGADDHAGRVVLDGPRAAQALGHLSLLDAARSPELAVLLGVAIEAGPLLKASGPSVLTLDPEPHGTRIRGSLSLPPSPAGP
jgi:hypothetical protein